MSTASQTASDASGSDALATDSRERAVRSLLRHPPLRRLWNAQVVGGIGDALAVLVLLLLTLQAAVESGSFGSGYRGAAFAVAAVFGARVLSTLLFGAVLLGPMTSLTAPSGPFDRRWTMIGSDGLRLALLVVAPLWLDWTPDNALAILLVTVFLTGVAERFWTVAREGAAPALLPAPAAGGRFRTAPAGPPRVAAHAVAAHRLRRRTRRGRGPPGRHADRQPAGHGRRVVLPAPGGPRLLPRGRTVRRVRLDPLLRRAARLADAPAALAAGGSAAAVQG
ncbi:hypothetical protein RKD30_003858 [Streptomyces pristinaespiralis]